MFEKDRCETRDLCGSQSWADAARVTGQKFELGNHQGVLLGE